MPFPGALHCLYFLGIPQEQPSRSLYHLWSRCLPASSLCPLLSQPEHPSIFTAQCTALIICSLVRETSVTPTTPIDYQLKSKFQRLAFKNLPNKFPTFLSRLISIYSPLILLTTIKQRYLHFPNTGYIFLVHTHSIPHLFVYLLRSSLSLKAEFMCPFFTKPS